MNSLVPQEENEDNIELTDKGNIISLNLISTTKDTLSININIMEQPEIIELLAFVDMGASVSQMTT